MEKALQFAQSSIGSQGTLDLIETDGTNGVVSHVLPSGVTVYRLLYADGNLGTSGDIDTIRKRMAVATDKGPHGRRFQRLDPLPPGAPMGNCEKRQLRIR